MKVPKKSLVVIHKVIVAPQGHFEPQNYNELLTFTEKSDKDKCKQIGYIISMVLLILVSVTIKILCFIMLCKFFFQQEENFLGFKVKMFSFTKNGFFLNITKTNWAKQYKSIDSVNNVSMEYNYFDSN